MVLMNMIVMKTLRRKAVEESPHEWTHPRVEPSCLFSLFCHQMGGMGGFLMAYGVFSHLTNNVCFLSFAYTYEDVGDKDGDADCKRNPQTSWWC